MAARTDCCVRGPRGLCAACGKERPLRCSRTTGSAWAARSSISSRAFRGDSVPGPARSHAFALSTLDETAFVGDTQSWANLASSPPPRARSGEDAPGSRHERLAHDHLACGSRGRSGRAPREAAERGHGRCAGSSRVAKVRDSVGCPMTAARTGWVSRRTARTAASRSAVGREPDRSGGEGGRWARTAARRRAPGRAGGRCS
jgi:hypothetical protein